MHAFMLIDVAQLVATRAAAAGSGAEYFQAVRAFSNAASSDAGSLLSGLQG